MDKKLSEVEQIRQRVEGLRRDQRNGAISASQIWDIALQGMSDVEALLKHLDIAESAVSYLDTKLTYDQVEAIIDEDGYRPVIDLINRQTDDYELLHPEEIEAFRRKLRGDDGNDA